MRKYKKSFILIFVSLFLTYILKETSLININVLMDKPVRVDYYWNVINFGAIISGFMFTLLGVIISTIDKKVMRRLMVTTIVDEIYINISLGVCTGIFSIMLSLFLIFIGDSIVDSTISVLAYLDISSIVLLLFSFIKGVKDIVFILNKTIEDLSNEGMTKERRQRVYDEINKKR